MTKLSSDISKNEFEKIEDAIKKLLNLQGLQQSEVIKLQNKC